MQNNDARQNRIDTLKKMLGVQIKLDIAAAIRQHPHLDGAAAAQAYEVLANEASIDQIVRELAGEEIDEALTRGDVPGAASLLLAGYRVNASRDS